MTSNCPQERKRPDHQQCDARRHRRRAETHQETDPGARPQSGIRWPAHHGWIERTWHGIALNLQHPVVRLEWVRRRSKPVAPVSWKTATSVRGPDWAASRTHFGAYEEGSSALNFRSSRLPKESSRAYSGLTHELAGQRPVARAELMLAMSLSRVRARGRWRQTCNRKR